MRVLRPRINAQEPVGFNPVWLQVPGCPEHRVCRHAVRRQARYQGIVFSLRARIVAAQDQYHQPGRRDLERADNIAPNAYANLQLNDQHCQWRGNISTVARDGIKLLKNQGALAIVNSNLSYRSSRQWQWAINIRNLFDQTYSTPQNQILGQDQLGGDVQEMPSRGREFFISLRYSPSSSGSH